MAKLYLAPKTDAPLRRRAELEYHIEVKKEEPPVGSLDQAISKEDFISSQLETPPLLPGVDALKSLFQDRPDLPGQAQVFERAPEKVKGLKVTKEVSIPILKSEKIDTPGYAMYTSIIRDRIRARANINFIKFTGGDVYLTFVIRSDGSLTDVQVLQNRTQASESLCAAGIASIQEASPFPPFPKELNYPELTFNIQISFQLREDE